jgi:hypothetical protein
MRNNFHILLMAAVFFALVLNGCPKSPVGKLTVSDGGFEIPEDLSDFDQADGGGGFVVCEPCVTDATCLNGHCISLESGDFCLDGCAEMQCPEGFSCEDTPQGAYCVPQNGICACPPEQQGTQKACAKSNDSGTCVGLATCDLQLGWLCDAGSPAPEICDYEDNNCDGEVDEDFMAGDWYFGPENCGDCGIVCADEIDHGTGYCSLAPPPPICKVGSCEPGYVTIDGLTCVLLVGSACVECVTDEDCIGGKCLDVDGMPYCLPECEDTCPQDYVCTELDEGTFCVPESGSCECTPETVGQLSRSCLSSSEFGTCSGFEYCLVEGWSVCDAKVPVVEDCNGIDDNCNGVIDEELSGAESCVNSIPGVGSCPGLLICDGENGYYCNAPEPQPEICDYKDNNCDNAADEGFIDEATGLYLLDTHCGACNNDCTPITYPQAFSVCAVNDGNPQCAMQCLEGWVDLNEDEVDGCECEFLSADDPPDGIDQNCDGIDGDPDNAIFVSPTGNDLNPGTPEQPVKTVSMGIQRCQEQSKGHVYVAEGNYKETVELKDGIQVFGGFNHDFSVRDFTLFDSALEADPVSLTGPQAAVIAVQIGITKSTFEGFTVSGPYVPEEGRSSYAIYLRACGTQLIIRDNIVMAGDAGDAVDGEDGSDGQDGIPGVSGKAAYDIGMENCANVTSTGGGGGQMTCGDNSVSGGSGGASVCPDFDEWAPPSACPVQETQDPGNAEYGTDGKPFGPGGQGGEPGRDAFQTVLFDGKVCGPDPFNCSYCHLTYYGTDGQAGTSGSGGGLGQGGSGCASVNEQIVSGEWQGISGGTGLSGQPGSGGGGGGAGGGIETYQCLNELGGYDIGGSGGGGGSGGCSGTGGTAGLGGGGSFGIFVLVAEGANDGPEVTGNQVDTGFGGDGGKGGKAGVGGTGGWGGPGGSDGAGDPFTWCAGEGGEGGHGGNGGSGGGGGGGCGGTATGIYVQQGSPAAYLQKVKSGNSINLAGSGGAGGTGGSSKGNSGNNGTAGAHQAFNF